ncbi:MAG: FRG domain-containing protein [bacterium]
MPRVRSVPDQWPTTRLTAAAKALPVLAELRGRRWLCRGQSKPYQSLVPSIDRPPRDRLGRAAKLALERTTIDLFRSTARFFADPGEHAATSDDMAALLVLRHFGVPSRILDWSVSPWVALFFAVETDDPADGELWVFDEHMYEERGRQQWSRWPETTTDGSGDPEKWGGPAHTAFSSPEPPDWFVCLFYQAGFHRQDAQQGAYSMTARFGRDHATMIANLLGERERYHRYVIDSKCKPELRSILRERHGIWRGSLFPDSAGAAETARRAAFPEEV